MKNNKKDIFRKVIRQAEADKPGVDFTDLVMMEVFAEARHEIVINPTLKSLLQKQPVETVSTDFTAQVMAQLDPGGQEIEYEPVIPAKAWYVIAAVILLFTSFFALQGGTKSAQQTINYPDKISSALNYFAAISPLYFLTLLMISLLLFGDYFLNHQIFNKKHSHTIQNL